MPPTEMIGYRGPVFRCFVLGVVALVAVALSGCPWNSPRPTPPLTTVTTSPSVVPSTAALLRQVFDLSCAYSGQILSYNKMLGRLQDAGNTTTIAHYLNLLGGAGLVTGVETPASTTSTTSKSPTTSTSISTSVTPTVSRPPDTLAESDERPALEGKFISVIVSEISETGAEAARADLESRFGLQFGILRSDDFRSLNPGYWVVYAGPFATAEESQSDACRNYGLDNICHQYVVRHQHVEFGTGDARPPPYLHPRPPLRRRIREPRWRESSSR